MMVCSMRVVIPPRLGDTALSYGAVGSASVPPWLLPAAIHRHRYRSRYMIATIISAFAGAARVRRWPGGSGAPPCRPSWCTGLGPQGSSPILFALPRMTHDLKTPLISLEAGWMTCAWCRASSAVGSPSSDDGALHTGHGCFNEQDARLLQIPRPLRSSSTTDQCIKRKLAESRGESPRRVLSHRSPPVLEGREVALSHMSCRPRLHAPGRSRARGCPLRPPSPQPCPIGPPSGAGRARAFAKPPGGPGQNPPLAGPLSPRPAHP